MKPVIRSVIDGGSGRSLEQQIAALFASGEQGVWYDIDPAYCFQDTAGTTPTAIGDPVGLVLDRSGRGNHASQTTATSRPILRQNAVTGAYYLEFDGSDDWLVTSSIDFTATDKMTVWAGVRKMSDAVRGMLVENTLGGLAGSFAIQAPSGASANNIAFTVVATLGANAIAAAVSPVSFVVTGSADISGDITAIRKNGALADSNSNDLGAGQFANSQIFIGRRGGTTLPFNGHIYSLIIRGAASNDPQIKIVERYLAQKTGVTLA